MEIDDILLVHGAAGAFSYVACWNCMFFNGEMCGLGHGSRIVKNTK